MAKLNKIKKRIITHIIEDISPEEYEDTKKQLATDGILFDGILIECKSRKGYVWVYNDRGSIWAD